ncbi:hypothetical protein Clacol_003462 [Clathrus columnatus]|uniref:Uncharacterized protein n=1 Tax=Clathrus columnatus TaxID=1419009 RepID=A0AAV5A4M8_9AGAM|nr:hypothetical protein Clacol_003462 [Clathrus columnatus]
MPLPDILPPEIWYNIIETEEFPIRDKRAMLAVAPLTTAKGMHDAAFSSIFQSLNITFFGEYDPVRLASKLSLYSSSDSLRLRSAVHYLYLYIDLDGFSKNTASSLRIENLICDVLTTLPNLTEVEWVDIDPCPLDLRIAKSLRCLSLQHCQFNLSNDDPWVISDGKIRTLLFSLEHNPRPDQLEPSVSTKPQINIFSRAGFDLSSLTTFVVDIQSISTEDLSYILPSSLSNNVSVLGVNLQCLTLLKVDYELALALGNSSPFPSLRSCSLLFSKNQVTSRKFSSSMRYLCVFLGRHTSLEVLVFGVSNLVLETNPTLQVYDTELCSENFVNTLLLLKNLKRLNLICYNFSLNHPAFRISPLANLEFLVIQTTHAVLSPAMAGTVAEKLKPHPSLRLFILNIYGDEFPESDALNFFAQKLKEISTQIKFAAVNYVSFWLQNEDKPEPDRLDPGHFMYQSYVKLLRVHKDVYNKSYSSLKAQATLYKDNETKTTNLVLTYMREGVDVGDGVDIKGDYV